jgi:hypothetical protein
VRVPKWCSGPVVYLLAFASAAVAFYAMYPVMWLKEKVSRAQEGTDDA